MPSERFSDGIFLRFPGWRRIRKRRAGWIVGWVEACRIRRIRQIYRRHSHESGNPGFRAGETFFPDKFPCRPVWIPACAGMTVRVFLTIHRAVATVFFTPSGKNTKTQISGSKRVATTVAIYSALRIYPVPADMPSFPRRRESSFVGAETYRIKRFLQPRVLDSHFRGNDGMCFFMWI